MYLISLPKVCFRTRTSPLTWEIRKSLPWVKSRRAKQLSNRCLRYEFSSSYLGIWRYVQRLDESLHSENIKVLFDFELLLIRKNYYLIFSSKDCTNCMMGRFPNLWSSINTKRQDRIQHPDGWRIFPCVRVLSSKHNWQAAEQSPHNGCVFRFA